MLQQHSSTDADLTIASIAHPLKDASQFGVMVINDNQQVIDFQEKPAVPKTIPGRPGEACVSMGVYVFKRRALRDVLDKMCGSGRGVDFGKDVIPHLIPGGRTFTFDFGSDESGKTRYWRDIGTLDAYFQTNMDTVGSDPVFDPHTGPGRQLQRSSSRMRTANSTLSACARVDPESHLDQCVVMPGAIVGRNAKLRRVIVGEGVRIPHGYCAGFDVEADRLRHNVTQSGVVIIDKSPEPGRVRIRGTQKQWATQSPLSPTAALAGAHA